MVKKQFRFPRELVTEIDEAVEDNPDFESRSQFVRVACRRLLEDVRTYGEAE